MSDDPWEQFPDAPPNSVSPVPFADGAASNRADPWGQFPDSPEGPPGTQQATSTPQVDKSATQYLPDNGPGVAQISTETKTVADPWAKLHAAALGHLVASGASPAQIDGFIRQTGGDPAKWEPALQQAYAERETERFKEWHRRNPGAPYPVEVTHDVALDPLEKANAEQSASPLGSFAEGAGSLGLSAAELAAAVTGNRDWASDLQLRRNLMAANHPGAEVAGQLAGALAVPSGVDEAGTIAARGVMREALASGYPLEEARNMAIAAARSAALKRSALEGAAYGGVNSAGSTDGSLSDRAVSGLLGAGIGGVVAPLATGAGRALQGHFAEEPAYLRAIRDANLAPEPETAGAVGEQATGTALDNTIPKSTPNLTENQKFGQAADRVSEYTGKQLDYLPADRPNALPTQWASSLTRLTLGGIPLTEAAQKVVRSAQDARDAIATKIGNFRTSESGVGDFVYAGQRLQRGAQQFLDKSLKRAGDLYDAIPIAPDRAAVLSNTRQALSDLTQGFTSNDALSKLWAENPRLKATLEALTPEKYPIKTAGFKGVGGDYQIASGFKDGQLSWDDMKRFRSILGEIIGRPGLETDGNQIASLRRLYGAVSQDMQATAQGTSPQAVRAFNRANSYFSARADRIQNTLAPILGKDLNTTPEDSYRALVGWSKQQGGDFAAVARTMRSLPEDDANTVRATILNALGRVSKGRQDQTGNVFSPSDFVTHWNDLSPRAKNILFQGDARRALDDLVTVASGMKASDRFANTSKTGIALGAAETVGTMMHNPVLGALSIVGQIGAGKLLGSPKVARWLTAYAKKPNPAAALAHVERLTQVARASPAIANEVLQLQERLAQAFTVAPAKLAADESSNSVGEGQGNTTQQ